jgi:hypothetical protein
MSNPYYNPEKFGLSILGEVEFIGGYEYDTVVVWRTVNGSLLWAEDSGCSCSSPFDDHGIDELSPVDFNELKSHLDEKQKFHGKGWELDIANLLAKVAACRG